MTKAAKNKFFVFFIITALCFTMNSNVTRWSENLLKLKKKYTYRYLSQEELTEIAEKQTRRKYFILKLSLCLLSFTILMGITIVIGTYIGTDFSVESLSKISSLLILSPSMIDISDERVEIIMKDGLITLSINGIRITFEAKSEIAKIIVIILSLMKVPPAPNRPNHLSYKTIAKCTGFSTTWVSNLIKRFDKYGISGLDRLPHGGILDKKARERAFSLIKEDITYTPAQINKILVKEGYLPEPNITAVRNTFEDVNLIDFLAAFRVQISGKAINEKREYLLDKLFSLIKRMLPHVQHDKSIQVDYQEIEKQYIKHKANTGQTHQWDQDHKGKMVDKIKSFKENRLLDLLQLGKSLIRCPQCGSTEVKLKEKYLRSYQDADGNMKTGYSKRYVCCQPHCKRNFSVPPADVGFFVQSALKLQAYALREIFKGHSLRDVNLNGVNGNADAHHTTILRWLKNLADSMPDWVKVFGTRCSGRVAIDEKWVKVRKKWHYVFIAIDIATLDIIHIDIYPERTKASAKSFLSEIKAMGYQINTIVTDCCPIYDKPIPAIYPEVKHVQCVLHMGRSRRNRLMKVFGSYAHKDYKKLSPLISAIYASRTESDFKEAWSQWEKAQKEYPQLQEFSHKLNQQKQSIRQRVLDKEAPRTSNHVERVILEFEDKYNSMQKFMSFPYAQAWCKMFQVYFRLRPFGRGRNAGKSPAEALGYPVKELDWTDFILPGKELSNNEAKSAA
ncbi:MAG: DDE-type integrase/transposase/recombinase [Atribacterota bacterium]